MAERDRLVAELAEGEKRMERLREEGRAAPPPWDVVGDEFLDDVAQMRQEILELRRTSSPAGTQISGVLWRRRQIQPSSLRTCCPKEPPNCPSWRSELAEVGQRTDGFAPF